MPVTKRKCWKLLKLYDATKPGGTSPIQQQWQKQLVWQSDLGKCMLGPQRCFWPGKMKEGVAGFRHWLPTSFRHSRSHCRIWNSMDASGLKGPRPFQLQLCSCEENHWNYSSHNLFCWPPARSVGSCRKQRLGMDKKSYQTATEVEWLINLTNQPNKT